MREGLGVVGKALEDVWDNLFLGAGCSLLWLGLTLLVLPAPGATVALIDLAQRVHARESPTLGEYWRLVWQHFGLGWRWAACALPVILVLLVDLRVAPALLPAAMASAMRVFAVVALAVWAVVLAYSLPLLFRQETPGVLQALRNGGVMALHNPLFSLTLLLVGGVLLWISVLLVVVSLLASPLFCAFLATRAVDNRLAAWRAAQLSA